MDNQHKLIKGYQDFPQSTVDRINWLKEIEQQVTGALENVAQEAGRDYSSHVMRHLAIARTELETGFMYLIKAVARPTNGLANAKLHGLPERVRPEDNGQPAQDRFSASDKSGGG